MCFVSSGTRLTHVSDLPALRSQSLLACLAASVHACSQPRHLLRQALEDKQQGVEPLMAEIDALDSQMTALEAMLERLDAATSQLNDKIVEANSSNHA